MGVATESGYTWTQGKHARLLHEGNRFPIKTITASEDSGSTADLVDNGLTRDRWIPFANALQSPADFGATADWTASEIAVSSNGQTLTETTANATHSVQQDFTFTAVEHVVAFQVERQTMPEVQVYAFDGTTLATCYFDLRDGTLGTATNCTGQIVDLGDGKYLLSIYFTAAAGSGNVGLAASNGSETVTFAGSTDSTVKVLRAYTHVSAATLRLDTFTPQGGTCIAIGAHTLGLTGARVTFEHDSNGDDVWTSIGTVTPTDNSPIMFFFDEITSDRWRITIDRGVLPEIGVVRIGDPLVFERPFYSGFTPARMNRATDVIGNMSRTGELIGRSIKRTILIEDYQWQNLTYAWVRANLDGPNGVIQSLEIKPAFMAWRPEVVTGDVSYIMRGTAGAPSPMGMRNLWTFSISAEVYSYE
jgi:hypothetical protein